MAQRKSKTKRRNSQKYYLVFITIFFGLLITWSIRQNDEPEVLSSAREDELVLILDDLVKQTDNLEKELVKQRQVLESLKNGSSEEAKAVAQRRLDQLIVLSGSAPVSGPGIQIRITGDLYSVSAFTLLDTVQELRDAGALAIEINGNRVVSNTYFLDAPDGIKVSLKTVRSPYILNVIGDPATLETALKIPGGIVETIQTSDGAVVINRSTNVDIDSIVSLKNPEYAVS